VSDEQKLEIKAKASVSLSASGVTYLSLSDIEHADSAEAVAAVVNRVNLKGVTEGNVEEDGIHLDDVPFLAEITLRVPEWYLELLAKYDKQMQEVRRDWEEIPDDPPEGEFYSEEDDHAIDESLKREDAVRESFEREVADRGWTIPF
jgi:hypothetical protein